MRVQWRRDAHTAVEFGGVVHGSVFWQVRALWVRYGVAVSYACSMGIRSDEGVLITGVYGAGKSTVAAEISYLLEQRRQPYALLDLDFLGWGVNCFDGSAAGNSFMLRNLAAVVSNYREEELAYLSWPTSSPVTTSCTVSGRLSGCRCGSFVSRCRCQISSSAWRPT